MSESGRLRAAYTYASTGYADPDAAASIGGTVGLVTRATTNGNLTTGGANTFSWDWRNHLNASLVGLHLCTYSYDENDRRTCIDNGTTNLPLPQ